MFRPHSWFCILVIALCAFVSNLVSVPAQQATANPTSEARDRGVKLYEAGKYKEVVSVLKAAVKKDKSDYQAWYFLGLAQVKLEDYKDATKTLQHVVQLRPDFTLGHTALAYSSLMRNRLDEAIREAESALRLDPKIKEAHYIIGVANLRQDNTHEALRRAEAVIKIDASLAVAYLLKSQALVGFAGSVLTSPREESSEDRKARYLAAREALQKYLELNPGAENKDVWLTQLDSLTFYLASHDEAAGPDRVFIGREVSTKARVLAKPAPDYTEQARRWGITGTVVLRCVFAADGTTKHFLIVNGLPFGLSERAIEAARKIKFTPATVNGKPVSMFIQLEYNFNRY